MAEAKARKKFKQAQRLEKLKKKADMLAGDDGMSEKEKAASISKLMAGVAKKTRRAPIKVVKAAGSNRGLQGRPKGGSYYVKVSRVVHGMMMLTRSHYYSQGQIQDGGSPYEEGVEGDEEDFQQEEIDVVSSSIVGGSFNCDTFLPVHIVVEDGCCDKTDLVVVVHQRGFGWMVNKKSSTVESFQDAVRFTWVHITSHHPFHLPLRKQTSALAIKKLSARTVGISFQDIAHGTSIKGVDTRNLDPGSYAHLVVFLFSRYIEGNGMILSSVPGPLTLAMLLPRSHIREQLYVFHLSKQ